MCDVCLVYTYQYDERKRFLFSVSAIKFWPTSWLIYYQDISIDLLIKWNENILYTFEISVFESLAKWWKVIVSNDICAWVPSYECSSKPLIWHFNALQRYKIYAKFRNVNKTFFVGFFLTVGGRLLSLSLSDCWYTNKYCISNPISSDWYFRMNLIEDGFFAVVLLFWWTNK